jgi:hypothetical protein
MWTRCSVVRRAHEEVADAAVATDQQGGQKGRGSPGPMEAHGSAQFAIEDVAGERFAGALGITSKFSRSQSG